MVTETLAGGFRAAITAHALQKSSPPSHSLQHQVAKNSTSWGCTPRGMRGAGNTLTAVPPTYWEPHVAFNHTPRLFSSRLGSYSNQGKSTWAGRGKEDHGSSDSSGWFYQLSPRSAPGRGAEPALAHGRSEARLCRAEPREAAETEPPLSCPAASEAATPLRGCGAGVAGYDLHA